MISCQLQWLNFLFGKGSAETRALSHAQMQIWPFRKKIDPLHGVKQKKKKERKNLHSIMISCLQLLISIRDLYSWVTK